MIHCLLIILALLTPLHPEELFHGDFSIAETLSKIPSKDQKIISDFFHGLLSQGDFASVLLSSKTSSSHNCVWWFLKSKNERFKNLFFLQQKGFQLWQKYKSLFPSLKFDFVDEGYHKGTFTFLFVKTSIKEATQTLDKNSLKTTESIQAFGKILGYPSKDIEDFILKGKLDFTLNFFPYEKEKEIYYNDLYTNTSDLLNGYPENLIEKWEHYNAHFKLKPIWLKSTPFSPSTSIGYATFDDIEVDDAELQQKIANLYNSDHFLEKILTLMAVE